MIDCPGITPYALSESVRNANIVNFNYTNQDFWSMKARLVTFIKERFLDDFNDFVESSLAIMLIENFAFIADTLSFKIDQIANEIFIDTVTELENAFRLSKLVGFQPVPPIASRSLWTVTLSAIVDEDVTIPTPFLVTVGTAQETIKLELFPANSNNEAILDEDIVISAGETKTSAVVGLQGTTLETLFVADGSIGQSYPLPHDNIIYDSIRVYVDGVQWNQVDYFTDSQPRKEFMVEYNSDYSAYVIFGNNRAGMIPSQGARITITYRATNGASGDFVAQISGQAAVTVTQFPYSLPFSYQNYTKGEFGYLGDTIEDIRRKLPEYLRTQDRAVTGLDYKTLADQFVTPYNGQIGKSTAALRNYGCAANIVDLYVLARNGDNGLIEATNDLKVLLQQEIDLKKMFTDHVCIKDGTIMETDVSIDVAVHRIQRKFEDELKAKINRRLDAFFALVNWDYGQDLKDTDIIKVLSDIREIVSFEITFTTNDPDNGGQLVTTKYNEIIRPDQVSVSFTYI